MQAALNAAGIPRRYRARVRARAALRRRVRPMVRRPRYAIKTKNPLAKYIRAVVAQQEETKYVANCFSAANTPLTPIYNPDGQISVLGDFVPAIPQVVQGTDDHQRIGNKINPKSLAVSLKISLNATDLSQNAIMCVIYYGTSKTEKTWQSANPLSTPAILDDGDGTNSSFLGNRFDLTKPLDRKLVTAKRIVFKLAKTSGLMNYDAGIGPDGNFATSNGPSEKTILLRFKPPKTLVYQQQASVYPVNYAPWYAIGFCHTDGSPYNPGDAKLLSVTPQVHMYYKDA